MPPPKTQDPIAKAKLLAGEGHDELYFLEALVTHLGLNGVQVEQYGGKNRLKHFVKELRVRLGFQNVIAVGIIRDTDLTVAQDFQSVCGSLTTAGFQPPPGPGQFSAFTPRVGVFLMPDNNQAGLLENLCLTAVQGDAAFPCLDDYFQCVGQKANRHPKEMAKARVHAWLASLDQPDLRLGEAAKSGLWP